MSLADAKQISVDAGRHFHSKRTESGAENFSLVEKDVFTLDWFAESLVKHSGVSKIATGR